MALGRSKILFIVLYLRCMVDCQLLTASSGVGDDKPAAGVNIECNSNNIMVKINTPNLFNGMIYPKGLSKNSSCKVEFTNTGGEVAYKLPLRSCNTMNTDVDDGVEYFNTVVIQPHRKLVTNQGRGYHIRCRYHTKDKTVISGYNVSDTDEAQLKHGSSNLGTTPLTATAPMPGCTMKIFVGNQNSGFVAENVKIGDSLSLIIDIDKQDIYGMKITDCIVRDGLNWGEQGLINSEGCPIEPDIMGQFEYSEDKTNARVNFQAHKFPYTASVYYQCNVRLCLKEAGGCDDVPPLCDASGRNILGRRRKRQAGQEEDEKAMTYEVYSGFYVNEAESLPFTDESDLSSEPKSESTSKDGYCITRKWFTIAMILAGILLIFFVFLCICCLVRKRRRKDDVHTPSSIYSGPYTNQAYSKN